MAFEDDLVSDAAIFLNEDEFAEEVTYRVASSGATSSVLAEIEDEGDTIQTDGLQARIKRSAVAQPIKGDQITRSGGKPFTIQFITDEGAIWVLDCAGEEEIQ